MDDDEEMDEIDRELRQLEAEVAAAEWAMSHEGSTAEAKGFESCVYAGELLEQLPFSPIADFVRREVAICTNRKVGERRFLFFRSARLRRIEGVEDLSGYRDADTDPGIVYELPSTSFCLGCRHYRARSSVR